jgi:hypothetical protein
LRILLAAVLVGAPAHALEGWTAQTFRGKAPTAYGMAGGAIEAHCKASASGLMRKE